MALAAGKLRQRIIIRKQTDTPNDYGEPVGDWQDHLTLWADFKPLSVNAIVSSKAEGSKVVARCVIRYRRDIDETMQVIHEGTLYNIDGMPLPDDKTGKEYLTLMLTKS
ncbi:MAG: phage head closure protein [Moraxella sp.]